MAAKHKSLFEAVSTASNSFDKEIKLIDMQDRLISGSENPKIILIVPSAQLPSMTISVSRGA